MKKRKIWLSRFFSPGVSFRCQPGQIYGLLGANGAGKTTTLRMLATILQPTDGSARVAGFDITESATIYAMPQCVRAVQYDPEMQQAREELDLFEEVLDSEAEATAQFCETFVTAATPGDQQSAPRP